MDGIGLCFLSPLICVTGHGYADIWVYNIKLSILGAPSWKMCLVFLLAAPGDMELQQPLIYWVIGFNSLQQIITDIRDNESACTRLQRKSKINQQQKNQFWYKQKMLVQQSSNPSSPALVSSCRFGSLGSSWDTVPWSSCSYYFLNQFFPFFFLFFSFFNIFKYFLFFLIPPFPPCQHCLPGTCWDFWDCPELGECLDSIIFVGPLQLRIFNDSVLH